MLRPWSLLHHGETTTFSKFGAPPTIPDFHRGPPTVEKKRCARYDQTRPPNNVKGDPLAECDNTVLPVLAGETSLVEPLCACVQLCPGVGGHSICQPPHLHQACRDPVHLPGHCLHLHNPGQPACERWVQEWGLVHGVLASQSHHGATVAAMGAPLSSNDTCDLVHKTVVSHTKVLDLPPTQH